MVKNIGIKDFLIFINFKALEILYQVIHIKEKIYFRCYKTTTLMLSKVKIKLKICKEAMLN